MAELGATDLLAAAAAQEEDQQNLLAGDEDDDTVRTQVVLGLDLEGDRGIHLHQEVTRRASHTPQVAPHPQLITPKGCCRSHGTRICGWGSISCSVAVATAIW